MSTSPDAPTEQPAVPEMAAEFAAILAFENLVKDLCSVRRGELYAHMDIVRQETGAKSFSARTDDGDVMAEFTLKDSQATYRVANAEAFLGWVLENFPLEVEMNPEVRPAFTKALLSKKRLQVVDEGVLDTETGLLVEGVEYVPSKPATSFGTSWKPGGKEAAAAALLEGAAQRLLSTYVAAVGELEAAS